MSYSLRLAASVVVSLTWWLWRGGGGGVVSGDVDVDGDGDSDGGSGGGGGGGGGGDLIFHLSCHRYTLSITCVFNIRATLYYFGKLSRNFTQWE